MDFFFKNPHHVRFSFFENALFFGPPCRYCIDIVDIVDNTRYLDLAVCGGRLVHHLGPGLAVRQVIEHLCRQYYIQQFKQKCIQIVSLQLPEQPGCISGGLRLW